MEKITLEELRFKKRMTQEQVAKEIGISTQTYNSWEKDFGKVKIRNAQKIANFYGVKLDEIFFAS